MPKVNGEQVYGDSQVASLFSTPRDSTATSRRQNPLSDLKRNRTLGKSFDKDRRCYHAARRMLPPQQGFRANDCSVIGANLWLEMQDKFLVDPCAAELIIEGTAGFGIGPKRWNEIPDTPPTSTFRTVQGEIGIREQTVGIGAVGGSNGNPNTCGDKEFMSVNFEAVRELVELVLCDLVRNNWIAAVAYEQDELVASQSVGSPRITGRSDPLRNLPQQLVADRMAERVINVLESIQPNDRDRVV